MSNFINQDELVEEIRKTCPYEDTIDKGVLINGIINESHSISKDQIKKELDNLDTYTVHMGAAQPDVTCVEFKKVIEVINKIFGGK